MEFSKERNTMAERLNMAGEGGVATEAPQPAGEVAQTDGITPSEVSANAARDDMQRLQKAQQLLGTQLTKEQGEAILEAHRIGAGEPGKDQSPASIGNYTTNQLLRKARILKEAGFSKEQVHNLLGSGIAGVLPASEISLDLVHYAGDVKLGPIVGQILATANAGGADEGFFNRTLARLERLQDEGTVNEDLANELLANLELWKLNAIARPAERRVERRQVTSVFDGVLTRIRDLEAQPPSADRDRRLQEAIQQRDNMRVEFNRLGFFNNVKGELFQTYYDSRVEVTRKQKLYGDEYSRQKPKLQELAEMQQDPNSWEARKGFWSDPQRQVLEATYGGIVDDFYQESLSMIRVVVNNRNAVLSGDEVEKLNQFWNYSWEWDPGEDHREMSNFDDVREQVEKERKKRYFVPSRGDYESWIMLVADDLDEVEESIPFMLDYIRTKFQPNDPNKVFETVEQEKDKIIKALDKFGYERGYEIGSPEYRKVRRVKSRLGYEINLAGAEYFAKLLHESWDPYLKFMGTVARSFQDTETQDHFIDAILLDNDGMMMLAIDQFEANDGEYWRYGRNTAATQNNLQIGDGQRWQANRREGILNHLVNNELKPMDELLQNHPAFQRLRAQLEQLDQEDIAATTQPGVQGYILDAAGNRTSQTRWQEYTEKALEWQGKRTIGDPRDKRQRVLFQHPLARALTDQEFRQMYRPIQRIPGETDSQFNRRLREKKERMQATIDTALRIATAFQQDAHAGLARHVLTPAQKQELGLPVDDEAIPHNRLMRAMLERAVREDAAKPPKRQRFKLTHVLQRMGLERDLPLFSNWYLGAHDTIRPGLIFNGVSRIPELMEWLREKRQVRALDPDDYLGGDFKTSLAREPEAEREFWEIMEVYVREQYPNYFNFPGHDTAGGGVKEMRNALAFPYGQSWATVELSSLVKNMWLGEQAFLPAFGCSTWKQFVGLAKGGGEIVFQRMGGLFESPRDAENWVKRIGILNEQSKLLTSGGEKGGHGILNDGWGSGFYRWRALNRNAKFVNVDQGKIKGTDDTADQFLTIRNPDLAYGNLTEETYEAYINLAAQFIAPLVSLFQARLKLENVYGRNPGTAMFLNTLTWYSVSNWMDRNWEEYRGKFGNALDVNLHMARKFIRTFLYENRFMYYDDQWDRLMLGYTIPTKDWERIQKGPYYDLDDPLILDEEKKRIRVLYKDRGPTGQQMTDQQIMALNWGDLTEEEKKEFKPIKKVIRYGVDATGQTLRYTKDEYGRIKFEGGVEGGYTVEGILDAFPKEWRAEIIARNNQPDKPWIIPMGLDTAYPETMGVIQQLAKFGEHPGMRSIYEDLLRPEQVLRQTRPRKAVKRL